MENRSSAFVLALIIIGAGITIFLIPNNDEPLNTVQTEGFDGSNGTNTLVSTINEPIGENCSNGGIKVILGIDNNNN
jgi:hypothetical protein